MSRYLTPSKLCLALLIKLYRDDAVLPSDGLIVLSFISSLIFPRSREASEDAFVSIPEPSASLQSFQKALSPLNSHFPGYSLYDAFLELIWKHTTPDHITTFLESVRILQAVVFIYVLMTYARVYHKLHLQAHPKDLAVLSVPLRNSCVAVIWSTSVYNSVMHICYSKTLYFTGNHLIRHGQSDIPSWPNSKASMEAMKTSMSKDGTTTGHWTMRHLHTTLWLSYMLTLLDETLSREHKPRVRTTSRGLFTSSLNNCRLLDVEYLPR
jgi:hypothetical protein